MTKRCADKTHISQGDICKIQVFFHANLCLVLMGINMLHLAMPNPFPFKTSIDKVCLTNLACTDYFAHLDGIAVLFKCKICQWNFFVAVISNGT